MPRRPFVILGLMVALAGRVTPAASAGTITLPGAVATDPLSEVTLFAFDDYAFPYRNHAEPYLHNPSRMELVLPPGPENSHDGAILFYGTVIRTDGKFRMWYNGNFGPERPLLGFELAKCCICYAESDDGIHWTKPELGLVEFAGSRKNNIVDFPDANLWSTCALVFEPEDPNPERRYKMAYESHTRGAASGDLRFCVAFSPDGMHWHPSAKNPLGVFLEMTGLTKWNGLYYLTGQPNLTGHRRTVARRLGTFVSADFETWSPCAAVGLERSPDLTGPSTADNAHQYEEIHLGAGLWNRGNVLLGIYGQWHGDRSGDRHMVTMDLGLVLSNDGLHYREPIPNFRLIPAREQPGAPLGEGPTLMQGQGMANRGDETLYWYSLWRGRQGSGVRVAVWPRDRLGSLRPFDPDGARAISCPILSGSDRARVFINIGGLGPHCRLKVGLLDEGFHPLAGFSGADEAVLATDGFRVPVSWRGGAAIPAGRRVRLDLRFDGVRPEDAKLYAAYVSELAEPAP